MSVRNLDVLFRPRSVALIGASKQPRSVGAVLAHNLLQRGLRRAGDAGQPARGRDRGRAHLPSIDALPLVPDLAVVATPPSTVPQIVADARRPRYPRGGRHQRGLRRARRGGPARCSRRCSMRPSRTRCASSARTASASWCRAHGLNASFAQAQALPGDLAFVSQSGAVLTSVLDWATRPADRLLPHGLARRHGRRRLRRHARLPRDRPPHARRSSSTSRR